MCQYPFVMLYKGKDQKLDLITTKILLIIKFDIKFYHDNCTNNPKKFPLVFINLDVYCSQNAFNRYSKMK